MITYKTDAEIEIMRVGGEKLKAVMKQLVPQIHAGMTTNDVNKPVPTPLSTLTQLPLVKNESEIIPPPTTSITKYKISRILCLRNFILPSNHIFNFRLCLFIFFITIHPVPFSAFSVQHSFSLAY